MYSLYTNDVPTTPGTHDALFTDNMSVCNWGAKTFVCSKWQGRHTNMELWCEWWNIKKRLKDTSMSISGLKMVTFYSKFVRLICPVQAHLWHFLKWKTGFHYENDIYLPHLIIQVITWHKKRVQQYNQVLVQNTWNRKVLQSNYKIIHLRWTMNHGPQMCKMQCW
jgi:hypothetical protein